MRSQQATPSVHSSFSEGTGWKLRDYFTSGKLSEHLIHAALVRVVTLEAVSRRIRRSDDRLPESPLCGGVRRSAPTGVQEEVVLAVPRGARFVWPDELRRN